MKKVFLTIQTILYLSFIFLDLFCQSISSSLIKYTTVIACFLYCICTKKKTFVFSFLFTLISDYFLLVRDSHYEVGVGSFIIVQMIYLSFLSHQKTRLFLPVRLLLFIAGILILSVTKQFSFLNTLIIFYFVNLFMNAVSSCTQKRLFLFTAGLALFVCCDICVGLHNLTDSFLATLLMWVFYTPSQTLIALS